ncbi:DUF2569 family protein [Sediminitomix flava]|uniref:Uncharacterized protein DUF2569 n=1 Tax=Sediminitomix flava TaxID=379075 RepID=A0A315YVT0_SEDFL|nr:DUF2569 family protein [Sediminitomix flava]PWJ32903.1 uncharacterized protein DUF2569 [Sediminitomix flava]
MKQSILHTEQPNAKENSIGGWLWVIIIVLLASGLQTILGIVTTFNEMLADDWSLYFQSTDELLKTRIKIYIYLISYMTINLGLIILSLVYFFQKKKKFVTIFLSLLGFALLAEFFRVYFLSYYADLTAQDSTNLDSSFLKTGIVLIISGLYLNKGRRPLQTFIN